LKIKTGNLILAKGDGKVFVTNVEDALDICTKEKGESVI